MGDKFHHMHGSCAACKRVQNQSVIPKFSKSMWGYNMFDIMIMLWGFFIIDSLSNGQPINK